MSIKLNKLLPKVGLCEWKQEIRLRRALSQFVMSYFIIRSLPFGGVLNLGGCLLTVVESTPYYSNMCLWLSLPIQRSTKVTGSMSRSQVGTNWCHLGVLHQKRISIPDLSTGPNVYQTLQNDKDKIDIWTDPKQNTTNQNQNWLLGIKMKKHLHKHVSTYAFNHNPS